MKGTSHRLHSPVTCELPELFTEVLMYGLHTPACLFVPPALGGYLPT